MRNPANPPMPSLGLHNHDALGGPGIGLGLRAAVEENGGSDRRRKRPVGVGRRVDGAFGYNVEDARVAVRIRCDEDNLLGTDIRKTPAAGADFTMSSKIDFI